MAKMKKVQPAVKTVWFNTLPVDAGQTGTSYIDLSQVASLVNRRFYRQGLQWAVGGIKILSGKEATIIVSKLPETWVMSNAWEKGFRAWQKMNKDATQDIPTIKPKFLDFKIYADPDHHNAGFGANLLPQDLNAVPATAGEWVASKFSIPRTDGTDTALSREVIATGMNYPGASPVTGLDAVSLIEGYASSRNLPTAEQDPNTPDDAASVSGNIPENWIAALTNEANRQDEVVVEDMLNENNQAPYPFENDKTGTIDTMYPGGANQLATLQVHDIETISATTIGGMTNIKGGIFPCGLIRIDHTNSSSTNNVNLAIQLDLVPGNHRGYLAEPMTEM